MASSLARRGSLRKKNLIRCGVWKNSFMLWNDVADKSPAAKAFLGRGMAYNEKGDYDNAVVDFDHAISV
jgi:hypothetical protein